MGLRVKCCGMAVKCCKECCISRVVDGTDGDMLWNGSDGLLGVLYIECSGWD
jgi:hypothetical protein